MLAFMDQEPLAADPAELDDVIPLGIVRFGDNRRVASANTRAHALLAVAPGRLVGRSVMETFLDARVETVVDAGAGSTELRVGDGEPRTVVLRVIRPSSGGTVAILEDVTELRRLRQIRTEFVDNLSHELRTPLSTVSLLAETLAREAATADVPERMRERIAKIEVETGHLVQMVSELLDLARIEGGTQIVPEEDVDLVALARSSTDRLRLFAERQGVTFTVEAAGEIPSIRGDESRLGQVFVNLVHNAVKFSPDGGEVRIAVRAQGDDVRVEVIDHGIGIARADRARVFERFYKADRARVRGGGTGLGLAIARHIVAAHGGRIGVDSDEGRGATFFFALPVHQPSAAPEPAADPRPSIAEHPAAQATPDAGQPGA